MYLFSLDYTKLLMGEFERKECFSVKFGERRLILILSPDSEDPPFSIIKETVDDLFAEEIDNDLEYKP